MGPLSSEPTKRSDDADEPRRFNRRKNKRPDYTDRFSMPNKETFAHAGGESGHDLG
jgi:hypothetical protein